MRTKANRAQDDSTSDKMSERVQQLHDLENARELGSDFAPDMVGKSAAECAEELNALKRHLRSIPKTDHCERAEALACIMHIRARQFQLAAREATLEHERHLRDQRRTVRMWRNYEASNDKPNTGNNPNNNVKTVVENGQR
jgi:hypothetical protein